MSEKKTLRQRILSENSAIALLVVGFFIMIIFVVVFLLAADSVTLANKPDTDLISKYGDLVGGITGSLWALAGVILFYLALESQKEGYELSKTALDKQIEALNTQISEFKTQGTIFTRTAVAQEKTQQLLKEQYELDKSISQLEILSSLSQIHADLARLETNKKIKDRYKEASAKYITKLNKKFDEFER